MAVSRNLEILAARTLVAIFEFHMSLIVDCTMGNGENLRTASSMELEWLVTMPR